MSGPPALLALAGTLAAVVVGRAAARRRRDARRRVLADDHAPDVVVRLHAQKVDRIARRLRERSDTGPLSLRKRTAPHQVPKPGDLRHYDDKIDIGDLDAVLHIDVDRRLCVAEPGVTFVDLVAATLRHGLVPLVVPELETITIGGAVAGCSLESTSFRHGGFHDSCLEYEVLTARGEVLTCTPDNEHRLLFQMVHGTFGTLGILTRLTFRLLPAKPYVHVRYVRCASLAAYQAAIREHKGRTDVDFVDGIIHSPDLYVLSVGRFVDQAPYASRYDWVRIYYESTARRAEDYLATPDYFFRYERGVTSVRPRALPLRVLFGKLWTSSVALQLAHRFHRLLRPADVPFTLDVFVPFSQVEAFLAWYRREVGHFPLWCVPYRRVRDYEWIAEGFRQRFEDELWIDLAIYGLYAPEEMHARVEEKLFELGGLKTLISRNHYSEERFWQIWNRETYRAVKARTDPDNVFRDLYTKTCKTAMGLPA